MRANQRPDLVQEVPVIVMTANATSRVCARVSSLALLPSSKPSVDQAEFLIDTNVIIDTVVGVTLSNWAIE